MNSPINPHNGLGGLVAGAFLFLAITAAHAETRITEIVHLPYFGMIRIKVESTDPGYELWHSPDLRSWTKVYTHAGTGDAPKTKYHSYPAKSAGFFQVKGTQ